MGEVIGFVSLKGGVGKTTISAALASELANKHGKRVLLVDTNYSAPNLGIHMDIISPKMTVHDVLSGKKLSGAIHRKYGVDVVPGNFLFSREVSPMKLRNKLAHAKKVYDYVVLDASPSMNEEVLSTIVTANRLFLVTTPDYPSLSCCMKAAKIVRNRGKMPTGVIVNRALGRNNVKLEEIQESTGVPVVSMIREDANVRDALNFRVPANFGFGNFAREIKKLGNAIAGKKESRELWKRALFLDMDKPEVNRGVVRESFYKSVFKR